MNVDHMNVDQWIDQAWNHLAGPFSNEIDQSFNAWQYLKKLRDTGNSQDPDLAAAEHYMFARYLASATGDLDGSWDLIRGYEDFKKLAFSMNASGVLILTPGKKPSPPSERSVAYGWYGAVQGTIYYQKTHNGQRGKYPAAITHEVDIIATEFHIPKEAVEAIVKQLPAAKAAQSSAQDATGKILKQIPNPLDAIKGLFGQIMQLFPPDDVGSVGAMCVPGQNAQTSVSGQVIPKSSSGPGTLA